jgi:hypothetical protein
MIAGLTVVLALAVTPQMPLSLAGTDDALAVFENPAALAVRPGSEFYAIYNFRPVLWSEFFQNTSFIAKAGPLAAYWEPEPSQYGVALGTGGKSVYSGLRFRRDSLSRWDLSVLVRPAGPRSGSAAGRQPAHLVRRDIPGEAAAADGRV